MKNHFICFLVFAFAISNLNAQIIERMEQPILAYPDTKMEKVEDDYFGTKVQDPYRWLENENSKATKDWVIAQNKVTNFYLDRLASKELIANRLEELMNYPKVSSPIKAGDNYFFDKNNGLQNQSVIYIQKGREGEPKVFIDPNKVNPEGTTSISIASISDDNKYAVINRSDAGSDWSTFTIRDIATGRELDDKLSWIKFSSASWDTNGFYYSRYPEPNGGSEFSATNSNHMVYYHEIGTKQIEDKLIYENKSNPNLYHWTSVTEDNKYLILYAATGTNGYECYFMDLNHKENGFKALFTGFENKSSVVDHVNGMFLVHTDLDAPNYKLIAIDPNNSSPSNWKEVIPEKEHLLESVSSGGGKFYANYLEKACNRIYEMEYGSSTAVEIKLPGAGTVGGFSGKKDYQTLFYGYTSFNYPYTIFEYDIASGESKVFYKPELKFNPDDFESKQVNYKSKDGTDVSMFIVHKKGLEMNGKNPTYLYGYGGFNVSLTPFFSTSNIVLLENGGVFAMPNLRGGGEYGEEWHQAGMLLRKQNVFDDFIAAGEYLIQEKYTDSNNLAIAGGSNGGLLVGACMTQRPELYRVAFPAVGVMDMLRYHKFTVGWGWIPEYGCSDSSKVDFENLYSYSPIHNLKEGVEYPATMITTADHDDRVVPAHSFKFAATLQEKHKGSNPVLIRIETDAGHGAGKPTSKIIEEQADKWVFMFANMQVKVIY